MSITSTGFGELDAKLNQLATKEAMKVASSAIRKGMTVVAKAIKDEVKATFKIKSGNLYRNIGARLAKLGDPEKAAAKVGVNVGSAKQVAKQLGGSAPHLHLLALGTDERHTKKPVMLSTGKVMWPHSTGKVNPNDFVARGFSKSESEATQKIIDSLWAGIEKAAANK